MFAEFLARQRRWCAALILSLFCLTARAELIFDVFVGYGLGASDGVVAEGGWFPVTCEILNDGATFNGVVEVVGGQFGNGQRRVVALELPSGTKKRFTVPVYCPSKHNVYVDARLRNDKGKLIAEKQRLTPRTPNGHVDLLSPLVALLSKKHGAITFPEPAKRSGQLSPAITHLDDESFPENPIALEGIDVLYLHSSRALELKQPQYTALLAWLHGGGRLVVAVEQPGDVNSLPWLHTVLPCELGSVTTTTEHSALQTWLRREAEDVLTTRGNRTNFFNNLPADAEFEAAPMPITVAKLRDGEAIGPKEAPLMVTGRRGRGELTVLLFSPELEPFNRWVNRNWFWARLTKVPGEWLAGSTVTTPSTPLDGVFGAMVDSKQIRKLPIGWLLLLLVIYLIVIGPLDQIWLKRINKQMLTWITFPTYVVVFSGLIYFIGYTLRSGETEWNELQVVDVVAHGGRADLRGRTFGAAYSPVNASYRLGSDQAFATFRGEVAGSSGEQAERDDVVEVRGNTFNARVSVPVWTSQLYVNDWWRQDNPPITFSVKPEGTQWSVSVRNHSGKRIAGAKLIIDRYVHDLGGFAQDRTFNIPRNAGPVLLSTVQNQQAAFYTAVSQRRSQFGERHGGHIQDVLGATTAASFLQLSGLMDDEMRQREQQRYPNYTTRFISPRGFDLSEDLQAGSAVLIAHLPNETFATPLNKFTPRVSRKAAILRVIAPVQR